jgi:hypothetical protein
MEQGDVAALEAAWDSLRHFDVFDDVRSRTRSNAGGDAKLVRWNNYFDPLLALYPQSRGGLVLVHQEREDGCEGRLRALLDAGDVVARRYEGTFLDDLEADLPKLPDALIINVDIDYFFESFNNDESTVQSFSDALIGEVFDRLRPHAERARVVTIALSPEWCGGWDAGERVARIAFEHLGIEYPLPPA